MRLLAIVLHAPRIFSTCVGVIVHFLGATCVMQCLALTLLHSWSFTCLYSGDAMQKLHSVLTHPKLLHSLNVAMFIKSLLTAA